MHLQRSALVDLPAEHLFDVIEAAEHYPLFLPWCASASVTQRDAHLVAADLVLRWRGLHLSVSTRNPQQRPLDMTIHLVRGPFRQFEGRWQLTPLMSDACKVVFTLDCEFANPLLARLAWPVLSQLADPLVDAFIARARALPVRGVSAPLSTSSADAHTVAAVADGPDLAAPVAGWGACATGASDPPRSPGSPPSAC